MGAGEEPFGQVHGVLEEPLGLVVDEVANHVGIADEGGELLGEGRRLLGVFGAEHIGEVPEDAAIGVREGLEGPHIGDLGLGEVVHHPFVEVVVDPDTDGVEAPALEAGGVDLHPGVPPVLAEGTHQVGAGEVDHAATTSGLGPVALDELGNVVGGGAGLGVERVGGIGNPVEEVLHAIDEAMHAHAAAVADPVADEGVASGVHQPPTLAVMMGVEEARGGEPPLGPTAVVAPARRIIGGGLLSFRLQEGHELGGVGGFARPLHALVLAEFVHHPLADHGEVREAVAQGEAIEREAGQVATGTQADADPVHAGDVGGFADDVALVGTRIGGQKEALRG